MSQPYRTLFVGTLMQESFLSVGGRDHPAASMDSPLCLDGQGRLTLRGSGLAGALIATLRRILRPQPVPTTISGSDKGRQPSVWRCFNSHPLDQPQGVVRQHVAINAQTGAAQDSALFDVETLPPGTRWPFLLEVDTSRHGQAADFARQVLEHWAAGRCLLGREVARGLGWLRLEEAQEYPLTAEQLDQWPCARAANSYPRYIKQQFSALARPLAEANAPLPGWREITGTLTAGDYQPTWHSAGDGTWGLDSLSIGGHASDDLLARWNDHCLAPDGLLNPAQGFDPDFTVVTCDQRPYIPGSSLRGSLRHALARWLKANEQPSDVVDTLFGTTANSAKLLIADAFLDPNAELSLAWFQHHAEDEFAGGAYGSSKFDRVAVLQGQFRWKMVLEDADQEQMQTLGELLTLAQNGQIGLGGGQWRGHGWLHWQINPFNHEV